jgi:two-component system sensor histidine kinase RegB
MTPATASAPSSAAINLRRLLVLRLVMLAGLAAAVWLAVTRLQMALPIKPLAAILTGMAALNLLTWVRLHGTWPVRAGELFGQLLLDVAALSALLYLSGGPANPFVTLYLLSLALTAAALPAGYTWAMAAITSACYTALLLWSEPLPVSGHGHDDFGLHVLGMWAGFLLSAALIAYFAVKMAATLAEMRERELHDERVLALGALAAGAAHELGTPLATMAVLVKDLDPGRGVPADKLAILRTQIARCKEILSSLSVAAGGMRAEAGASRPLDRYLEELVQRWLGMRPGVRATPRLTGPVPAPRIVAEQTLTQAITSLLNNAADASPETVDIAAHWTQDMLTLEIADRGPGIAPEVRDRAGYAPVSTKGEGLGIGLYLARTTLQRLGGAVELRNRDGGGALCRLTLPLASLKVSA